MERELKATGMRWFPLGTMLAVLATAQAASASSVFELPLGNEKVEFFVEGNPSVRSPLVISLHRNESTAFPIVREILASEPGRFIGIRTPGDRRLNLKGGSRAFSIDPNRIFSRPGIEADLRKFSFYKEEIAREIETFAGAYLKATGLGPGVMVIAVHNNTDGGYSLESYRNGGSEAAAGAKVHRVDGIDPDDFILVTNSRHFEALQNAGFNVILQNNPSAPDDGSLSVYCGKQGIDYFNVEAEFGSRAEQERMLRAAFAIAAGKAPAASPLPVARPIESGAVPISPRPAGNPPASTSGEAKKPDEPAGKPVLRPGIRLFPPKKKEP